MMLSLIRDLFNKKKKKKQINLGLIIYITDMPSTTLTLILYIERITYN